MFRNIALLATFGLSACSSLVPSTLARLNVLDPLTADPAGFAIQMTSTSGYNLVAGSVVMTFEAVHSPSGETWRTDLSLAEERFGGDTVIYSITPKDAEALRVVQADLASWKESSDGSSSLSLTLEAEGCVVANAELPEDPRVSVSIQLAPDAPMRTLLRNGPLLGLFDVEDLAQLPQCDGPM